VPLKVISKKRALRDGAGQVLHIDAFSLADHHFSSTS
jgi:hypothetical protein